MPGVVDLASEVESTVHSAWLYGLTGRSYPGPQVDKATETG